MHNTVRLESPVRRQTEPQGSLRLIAEERERGRRSAATAYQEAQGLLAAQQIERAAEILEAVPPALRDEPLQNLLREVAGRRTEVSRIRDSLRVALNGCRASEALALLARLLEHCPEDQRARRLANQILEKYCRAAEQKLIGGHCKEALRLLDEAPPSLAVGDVADRYHRVAEWAGLAHSLRTAPVIDPAVVVMAERLRVVAPGDAVSAKLIEEIRQRAKRAADSGAADFPPLSAPPRQTPLGFPVDFLPPFRRIAATEKLDRQWLAANRGRLAVACGLALQGLDKAQVATNLLPGSSRRALSKLVHKLVKPSAAWGIDFGSTSLKCVRLTWNPTQHLAVMEAAECLEYRKPLGQAANADEQEEIIDEVLTDLLKRHRLKGARVCLGLPGRITTLQRLRVPAAEPAKLVAMIQHEVPRCVPIPLEELYWAYHVVNADSTADYEARHADSGPPVQTMVTVQFCAARASLVTPLVKALQRKGLHVDAAQSEQIALHNLWAFENAAKGEAGKGRADANRGQPEHAATALVDIGGEGGNLVISSRHGVWARSLNFGGNIVTRTLVKELNLTFAQAEQFKRNPSLSPGVYRFCRTVAPALEDLYHEVQQCLEAFVNGNQREPIRRMIGVGGEFRLHGLLRNFCTGET